MKFSEKQITALLDGIFDGTITQYDLPLDYYNAVVDYLKEGLYKGFGQNLAMAEGKDLTLLAELRDNVYMFGAAKEYQEVKKISEMLLDEKGDLRSQAEFNDLGRAVYKEWNDDWGKSEYNTAVGQGTMAAKWNEIEKNKDLLPMLTYSTIGDACDICEPLEGFTAPVDDPVWDEIYPLNHFNCECTVLQGDEDVTATPPEEKDQVFEQVTELMNPVFKNNPGKTGDIFPADYPYFNVPKEDKKYAENNFGLPIPSAEKEAGKKIK